MGQRLYTTIPMSPISSATDGPIEHGLSVSFDASGTIDGIYVVTFPASSGGTPSTENVTVKVKDATGSTTLATGTMAGADANGELYIPLSAPLSVSAGTNYQIIDAMSPSAYRYGKNTGGLTSGMSNGHITAAPNSGIPSAADETYVDLSFTAGVTTPSASVAWLTA